MRMPSIVPELDAMEPRTMIRRGIPDERPERLKSGTERNGMRHGEPQLYVWKDYRWTRPDAS